MNWIPVMLVVLAVVASLAFGIPAERKRLKLMARFWARACTGRDWKRRFPAATKDEIREFLDQFVDGFAYNKKERLKFLPDDKVMDIYHSEYPIKDVPDALELETFAHLVKKKYGVDLSRVWRPDITLGDLFALTRIHGDNA